MKNNRLSPADLSRVLGDTLKIYSEEVQAKTDKVGKKAVDELVRITKDTAPYDVKNHGTHFVDCITSATEMRSLGNVYIWYVKPPCHRLTHLLVHGHEARDGSRVRGDPFLCNAWDRVQKQYVDSVEEAVKNGK